MSNQDETTPGPNPPGGSWGSWVPGEPLDEETVTETPAPGLVRTMIQSHNGLAYVCNDDFGIAFMTIVTNMLDNTVRECDPDAMFSVGDVTTIINSLVDKHMSMLDNLQTQTLKEDAHYNPPPS